MDKTEEKRARRAVGANGSTTGGPGGGGKKCVALPAMQAPKLI